MKKFIITIILALVASLSFTANAQWSEPKYFPADELRGEEAYYANTFAGEDGAVIIWSNETDVKLVTRQGIFDYHDNYVNVIVGFYEGDKLVEKVTTKFYAPDGDSDTAYTSSIKEPLGLGLKIILHLHNNGKVRFIASKYSGADFDLTVSMNRNLKHEYLKPAN